MSPTFASKTYTNQRVGESVLRDDGPASCKKPLHNQFFTSLSPDSLPFPIPRPLSFSILLKAGVHDAQQLKSGEGASPTTPAGRASPGGHR